MRGPTDRGALKWSRFMNPLRVYQRSSARVPLLYSQRGLALSENLLHPALCFIEAAHLVVEQRKAHASPLSRSNGCASLRRERTLDPSTDRGSCGTE